MSNPLVEGKDLASITTTVAAAAFTSVTAGGAGNNVQVVGLTLDRENLQPFGAAAPLTNVVPRGALFGIVYQAALGAGNTLSINAVEVDDSADGITWTSQYTQGNASTPYEWPAAGVVDTGATGGSTQRGVVTFGTNIQSLRRYVRIKFTPDLSAASIDTADLMAFAVLSGIDEVPAGVV